MKFKLLSTLFIWSGLSYGQLLYDPTVVYATAGSNDMFDIEQVLHFELNFYDPAYHSILTDNWFNNDETRLSAELTVGADYINFVGVKYKGNSTFYIANLLSNPKVPYNIDINYYTGGANILGYKKVKLANALFDPTFTKEAVSSYVYRHYMPTHEVAIAKLTVNGSYLGAYTNTESIGKQFLDKHFSEKNGTFVKCEPIAQFGSGETFVPAQLGYEGTDTMNYYESYEIKSDSINNSWTEFIELLDILNNDPTNVKNILNVDRVLWYFAVTTVLPNEDAYNTMVMHNYYLYKTTDGKFQIIPWDLSETFCGAMIGQLTYADHYERDPAYGYTPLLLDHPLVFRLLSQPYYFKRYMHHVRTVFNEFYDQTTLKDWALALQSTIYDAVSSDPNKLFSMGDFVDNIDNNMVWFTTEIAAMIETMDNRKPYLQAHPEVMKVAPTIIDVIQNIENPSSTDLVYISAEVSGADNVYLKVTNTDHPAASDYIAVEMLDDGLAGDAVAGDSIFTAAVPFTTSNDHIKYYIEAENADAIGLMPARAEYYYYHYYVDQVVGDPTFQLNEISVYPNPASSVISISGIEGYNNLTLFNLQGELITQYIIQSNSIEMDVNHLTPGLYLLVAQSGNQKKIKRIVIN